MTIPVCKLIYRLARPVTISVCKLIYRLARLVSIPVSKLIYRLARLVTIPAILFIETPIAENSLGLFYGHMPNCCSHSFQPFT